MNDRHFANFHIAGFTYYEGADVFENLKIGTPLSLKAESENPYDPDAVAFYYKDKLIGYAPRTENKLLRKFLNLGHTDLFEATINQITPFTYPEQQVHVTVWIKKHAV
jgi:hypothetical protein